MCRVLICCAPRISLGITLVYCVCPCCSVVIKTTKMHGVTHIKVKDTTNFQLFLSYANNRIKLFKRFGRNKQVDYQDTRRITQDSPFYDTSQLPSLYLIYHLGNKRIYFNNKL
jgi:hypothetical protein